MLPFLPALTSAFHDGLSAFLPAIIVLPLVTITVLLLPGLFGFLFWELAVELIQAPRPWP